MTFKTTAQLLISTAAIAVIAMILFNVIGLGFFSLLTFLSAIAVITNIVIGSVIFNTVNNMSHVASKLNNIKITVSISQ